MELKIWLIEDDIDLSQSIANTLQKLGFEVQISRSLEELSPEMIENVDFIIADIHLTDGSIHEFFTQHLSGTNQPKLILTSANAIEEKRFFLDQGADDYLTKPFSMEELVLRINSIWRRCNNISLRSKITKELTFYPIALQLQFKEEKTRLTVREAQILVYLLNRPKKIVSQDELLEKIWGMKQGYHSNVISATLQRLRTKISFGGKHPKIIHSAYRQGYYIDVS